MTITTEQIALTQVEISLLEIAVNPRAITWNQYRKSPESLTDAAIKSVLSTIAHDPIGAKCKIGRIRRGQNWGFWTNGKGEGDPILEGKELFTQIRTIILGNTIDVPVVNVVKADKKDDKFDYLLKKDNKYDYLPNNASFSEVADEQIVAIQLRVSGTNNTFVEAFKEAMSQGEWILGHFIPTVVREKTNRGHKYYFPDGNHRLVAWKDLKLPLDHFPVRLIDGTKRDAELLAITANSGHELKAQVRDHETTRRNLLLALIAPEWADQSQAAICRLIGMPKSNFAKWSDRFNEESSLAERLLGRSLEEKEKDLIATRYESSKRAKKKELAPVSVEPEAKSKTEPKTEPVAAKPPTKNSQQLQANKSCIQCAGFGESFESGHFRCGIRALEFEHEKAQEVGSNCIDFKWPHPAELSETQEETENVHANAVESSSDEIKEVKSVHANTESTIDRVRGILLQGTELIDSQPQPRVSEIVKFYDEILRVVVAPKFRDIISEYKVLGVPSKEITRPRLTAFIEKMTEIVSINNE